MTSWLYMFAAFAAGVLIGYLFFGSLWIMVHRLRSVDRPGAYVFLNMLARLSLAGIGFYLVSRGDSRRLVLAFLGFVIARVLLINRLGIDADKEENGRKDDGSGAKGGRRTSGVSGGPRASIEL